MLVMCMLLLLGMAKWIIVLELRNMMAERRHVHHRGCVESISGRRHRERGPKAHAQANAHPRRMQVASLVMIYGICASWRWGVISRGLVCE